MEKHFITGVKFLSVLFNMFLGSKKESYPQLDRRAYKLKIKSHKDSFTKADSHF